MELYKDWNQINVELSVRSLLCEEAVIVRYYRNPDGPQTLGLVTAGDEDEEMTVKGSASGG